MASNAPVDDHDQLECCTFVVGDIFRTYEALERKLEEYKKTHYVEFWKRDNRTIETARRRMPHRLMKDDLRYYEIKFCCIHGGRPFQQKGFGLRKTSTFKRDCPAHISLRLNANGDALEVKSVSFDHNHEISKVLFQHLPQQRALSSEVRSKASELLSMNPNKKLLQQKLSAETNKVVLLKDISNIACSMKTSQSKNDLDLVVDKLISRYGATVEVYKTEDGNFLGLFIQDQFMLDAFTSYPEYIAIDATYKLLNLGLPLYIIICEDSNGMTEIVACCILVSEDAVSIKWMFEIFKKLNDKWDQIQVIMADKDMKERTIIKECFPQSALLICLFHVMRTFKREVTCDKMGISPGQKILCLELLQKLAYASSEQHYNEVYLELVQDAPQTVVRYYNDNWHSIRSEWVLGIKFVAGSFLNSTNNRLESLNGKLKQVIKRYSTLEEFVTNLFIVITSLRTERDHKAALLYQKKKITSFPDGSPEAMYSVFLTSYAFEFVLKQLQLVNKVTFTNTGDSTPVLVETSHGLKEVSTTNCKCIFNTAMSLPCRHVFALRKLRNEPLFDESLCSRRWSIQFYKSTQRVFHDDFSHNSSLSVTMEDTRHKNCILSQHEKFRKASLITTELASVASEASNIHFERRLSSLNDLLKYWKNGKEVAIHEVTSDDEITDRNDDIEFEDIELYPSVKKVLVQKSDIPEAASIIPLNSVDCPVNKVNNQESSASNSINKISVNEEQLSYAQLTFPTVNQNSSYCVQPSQPLKLGISLPPSIHKRGRPKGSGLTTIGLPAKKAKLGKQGKNQRTKPVPYIKLHTSEKEKIILLWFVDEQVVSRVLQENSVIEEYEVECRPEKIPSPVLDENVDVCLVRRYFSHDAWEVVEQVVSEKQKRNIWICRVCSKDLHSKESLCCDACLLWSHFSCVGLQTAPKSSVWYCRECYSKC